MTVSNGKNDKDDMTASVVMEIGNPQPISYARYDQDREQVQRTDDCGSRVV
jgi:hypothetical protein